MNAFFFVLTSPSFIIIVYSRQSFQLSRISKDAAPSIDKWKEKQKRNPKSIEIQIQNIWSVRSSFLIWLWSNMQRRWFTNPEKAKGPLSNSGQGRFCCFNLYLYIFIFLSSYLVLYCYPIFFISLCLTYLYTFNINIQYVMSIEIDFSKCR